VENERVILSPSQKALRINLNAEIYGTFAEIGAGQEVVRHFFRAGGASKTIAKAMSAYDKDFSDAIYGKEEKSRYVCKPRLDKMLAHEYKLIADRLDRKDHPTKPKGSPDKNLLCLCRYCHHYQLPKDRARSRMDGTEISNRP